MKKTVIIGFCVLCGLLTGCGARTGGLGGGLGGYKGNWSIYLAAFSDADHAQQSRAYKNLLQRKAKLRAIWIVHEIGKSTLYYGRYLGPEDRRAKRDLASIRSLADQNRRALFPKAILTRLEDRKSPSGPQGWRLINAPGAYSLQIAVYFNNRNKKLGALCHDRKKAAIAAVRALRKEGIEAYYYHGPVRSSVCVGNFPQGTRTRDLRTQRFPNPKLETMARRFPYNAENGQKITYIDGRTKTRTLQKSFLVKIPTKMGVFE